MSGYLCRTCGERHQEPALHYGFDAPAYWYGVPEQDRPSRCLLSTDLCVIDDQYFFILGNLELPIVGSAERFSWDVWVSLSVGNFARAGEVWEHPGREAEPPYFGWLSSSVPGYPDTINLKTMVHTRPIGIRPRIELEPTDHPLAVEQREGVTWDRIREIAERLRHAPDE